MTIPSFADGHDEELVPVALPSGAAFPVYKREQPYLNSRISQYLSDLKFTNVGDLADLDRIIALELFAWRWSTWLSQQTDYWGEPVNEKQLASQLKDVDGQIKAVKASLGIDKVTRDKVKGEDSVSAYIENLRVRAKHFGIKRDRETAKAIEFFKELQAKITLWRNTEGHDDERRELKCNLEDIVEWLETEAFVEFDEIDRHFRETNQASWIRSM